MSPWSNSWRWSPAGLTVGGIVWLAVGFGLLSPPNEQRPDPAEQTVLQGDPSALTTGTIRYGEDDVSRAGMVAWVEQRLRRDDHGPRWETRDLPSLASVRFEPADGSPPESVRIRLPSRVHEDAVRIVQESETLRVCGVAEGDVVTLVGDPVSYRTVYLGTPEQVRAALRPDPARELRSQHLLLGIGGIMLFVGLGWRQSSGRWLRM